MDHRSFRGDDGKIWEAWPVYPIAVEQRVTGEHPLPSGVEERRRRDIRLMLPPELQDGWLAFQRGAERRRLVPIPQGWESCPESELAAMLRIATVTPNSVNVDEDELIA